MICHYKKCIVAPESRQIMQDEHFNICTACATIYTKALNRCKTEAQKEALIEKWLRAMSE